jgi:hypothetical protein
MPTNLHYACMYARALGPHMISMTPGIRPLCPVSCACGYKDPDKAAEELDLIIASCIYSSNIA